MRVIFGVLSLAAVLMAGPQKNKFDQKIVNFGVKFFNKAEIAKGTACMEDPLYNQKSMDDMKSDGMSCVMGMCGLSKMTQGLSLMSQMDSCLKPTNQKTMDLVNKIFPALVKAIDKVFKGLNTTITKGKKNKKPKTAVSENAYKYLNSAVTKPLIATVCKNIVMNQLNKIEWNCALTVGKGLVDFNMHPECVKLQPKN